MTHWPFVWYLRNFDNAQFYGKKAGGPFDAEVVIVGSANEAGVKPFLGNNYYRRHYRLIWWPNQDWYMNLPAKAMGGHERPDSAKNSGTWSFTASTRHRSPRGRSSITLPCMCGATSPSSFGTMARKRLAAAALPGDEYVDRWQPVAGRADWGGVGSGSGQFQGPRVSPWMGRAISMWPIATIIAFRSWMQTDVSPPVGQGGNPPGQFKEPWGIAVGPDGDVYVADTWNHRIQLFDAQGQFVRMWGTFGEVGAPSGAGTSFYGPRDVVLDPAGNLYVSDTGNKRVVKFDSDGGMVGATGGFNDVEGLFQEPVGLAVSADGTLYVVDTWNQRIQAFDAQLPASVARLCLGWHVGGQQTLCGGERGGARLHHRFRDGFAIIVCLTFRYDGEFYYYEDFESFVAGTVPNNGRWTPGRETLTASIPVSSQLLL